MFKDPDNRDTALLQRTMRGKYEMTAYTRTQPATAFDAIAEGAAKIGNTLRTRASRFGHAPDVAGVRASLRTGGQRLFAALVANRQRQALIEIERIDPRLGAELRAVAERAQALPKA